VYANHSITLISALALGLAGAPAQAGVDATGGLLAASRVGTQTAPAPGLELPALVSEIHEGNIEHCDEAVADREFAEAFECGDELFETVFNEVDGVGANVGGGARFSRVPRADRAGPGEWKRHTPARVTGPNAQACNACHRQPFDDGAGGIDANVIRDPQRGGAAARFIQRNTPHLFMPGALQVVAEEMNEELVAIRTAAIGAACAGATGQSTTRNLTTKGVSFGRIKATRARLGGSSCPAPLSSRRVVVDLNGVEGVDDDLVVRPFQWKGVEPTVRSFNRDASHNELGMQAVEIAGDDVDGDGDAVVNEMTVADQTALAVYLSAQPRPVTRIELHGLRKDLAARFGAAGKALADELGLPALSAAEISAIQHGEALFGNLGCATCHTPVLAIQEAIFNEPSENPNYRDARFPAGQDPRARGVDPAHPISFDLTADPPDNVITAPGDPSRIVRRLGGLESDRRGGAIVRSYGDLKRHEMGPKLAESIDEQGLGASVWITKELWGAGSTAPYLHDGRATTLSHAILEHGGEAQTSRNSFASLSAASRADVIAFLENLVLFKVED
jgi:cytochrome c peroxidase